MSEKKHIDRLFQEKLKNFEAEPSAEVWDSIHKTLHGEKKERRIIPIWWKLGGVAAILALLLTVGNLIKNIADHDTPVQIVNINKSDKNAKNNNSDSDKLFIDNQNLNNSVAEESVDSSNIDSMPTENITEETTNTFTDQPADKSGSKSAVQNNSVTNTKDSKNYQITTNDHKSDTRKSIVNKNPSDLTNTAITDNTNLKNSEALKSGQNDLKSNSEMESEIKESNTNSAITKNENSKLNNGVTQDTLGKSGLNKDLIEEDALAIVQDSVPTLNENTIEEAIAATKDIIEKEEEINRWQVYTTVAPVYYNSMGKGSSIDKEFIENPKNGEINTSYGVNVGYAINDKLSVRSGVNSLKLSYDTANVILFESLDSGQGNSQLKNIDFTPSNQNFAVISGNNLVAQQISSVINDNYNAALSQRISYYEVPMELQYNISNRKLGVNLIGGFSTFFLKDHQVYSEFEGRKNYVGEANNINNVSFSTNVGLGLYYKFTEKLKFNFEPTFKYQINAYGKTAGNFNPYIIGVYTGFSYKF